jgi:hypothetical protein
MSKTVQLTKAGAQHLNLTSVKPGIAPHCRPRGESYNPRGTAVTRIPNPANLKDK